MNDVVEMWRHPLENAVETGQPERGFRSTGPTIRDMKVNFHLCHIELCDFERLMEAPCIPVFSSVTQLSGTYMRKLL